MYIIVPMSRNQTTTIHWKINKKQHSEFLSIMTRMVMRHGIIWVFIFTETCFFFIIIVFLYLSQWKNKKKEKTET